MTCQTLGHASNGKMTKILGAFLDTPKLRCFWGIVRSILFSRNQFGRPRVVKTSQEEGPTAKEADLGKRFALWGFLRAFRLKRVALRARTSAHGYGMRVTSSVCSMIPFREMGDGYCASTNPSG